MIVHELKALSRWAQLKLTGVRVAATTGEGCHLSYPAGTPSENSKSSRWRVYVIGEPLRWTGSPA
ncbi:hypothetical protein [Nostoc sp. CALU 1950]|uniref:hypothetical protein n=1 Tax=Nostoc sp. CALU 1950 TaxID=3104321 RepID=UPI003EBC46F9